MKILISICARGGSKGIPGKNIRMLKDKPLIAYSISCAKQIAHELNADVALSTDSPEIKSIASVYGLTTSYERPAIMATDHAGKLEVIEHVLKYHETMNNYRYNYQIDLDVTSPLRTAEDVLEGLKILEKNKQAMNLFSVNKCHRNPYFNMVEEDGNGYYKLVKEGTFLTRQSAPKVYDLNASFYIFKREFFELGLKTINSKSLIYEMPHICFDLDEPIDFEFMGYLLENDKLDF